MIIDEQDQQALRQGQPPLNPHLLLAMTLGQSLWLERIHDYYLLNYIADGGSKVKVLVGEEGSGKTQLLRWLLATAASMGYATADLSAQDYRLNDLTTFYRGILHQLDREAIVQGLCARVSQHLGYDQAGDGELLLTLMQDQGLTRDLGIQTIKQAVSQVYREADLSPSFLAFIHSLAQHRLIQENPQQLQLALRWLAGDPLERHERKSLLLFERLQKNNARYWFNSLIRLLHLAGFRGLIVGIDHLEVLTERQKDSRRYCYTPNAIKDTCELFRQIIDDSEVLDHFLLILAGERPFLEDERRGFKSYEALWMRLQTGLLPISRFNPFADIVDVDSHLQSQGSAFPQAVGSHLHQLWQEAGLPAAPPTPPSASPLRAAVMRATQMRADKGEAEA
ncbi:MAG: BREX system ATP-binding domain-containing protein [Cyanobacteriota bacterium]|nr:BREX system ATP-binding domain-containing protein [Cyanobacteriota bacterium]